jgi:putative proteasome-type protease
VTILLGGQIRGSEEELYLIYPQGNPLRATPDSPFLQIGETKYGRRYSTEACAMRRRH